MKKIILTVMAALTLMTASAQEMTYSPSATRFALWQPKAEDVRVNIYKEGTGGKAVATHSLTKNDITGTWALTLDGNLRGSFYTYQVKIGGKWREESPGIDAKAVGINGQRAAIIDLRDTNPKGWESDRAPIFHGQQNAVIYEMHHRDFSIHATSGVRNAGKFLALTEHGTKNADGLATGIDHLKELGVTHVHLLPSYDYGSIDEKTGNALGGGGRIPSTYNWGYDPVNYNVPEGSYSTNAADPAVRIREFKEMVMALHKAGIRVVMDVVYNHVFDHDQSQFHKLYPGEFFRYKDSKTGKPTDYLPSLNAFADGQNAEGLGGSVSPANGSGCGNETASDKEIMRQYMVESVKYWMKEYHVDGFRFDLMGIHDIETMNLIREAAQQIDPDVIIYGEGWAAESPAYPEDKLAMKANTAQLGGIAAFGDEMRDGLRGGWQNDKEGAFLIGVPGNEESVKFGIVGAVQHDGVDLQKVNYSKAPWASAPSQMISYVSCHDDMCIADRIKCTLTEYYSNKKASPRGGLKGRASQGGLKPDAFRNECIRLQKLAYATVFTSRGVPFIWCGDEIMRDRKGVHNCYTSPDSINAIPWNLKTENKEVFDYMCQLIQLRKELQLQHKEVTFLPVKGSNLIATQYGDDIIVILNSNRKAATVNLPAGNWQTVLGSANAVKNGAAKVPAQSALILRK